MEVVVSAKILGHEKREVGGAVACTFSFFGNAEKPSGQEYIEYAIKVSIVSPPLPYEPIIIKR